MRSQRAECYAKSTSLCGIAKSTRARAEVACSPFEIGVVALSSSSTLEENVNIETLSYGRGALRPLVPGVLRTPDGVVIVRPKAMRGPRKATGLLKLLVRSPPSSAASHQTVAEKIEFLERPSRA